MTVSDCYICGIGTKVCQSCRGLYGQPSSVVLPVASETTRSSQPQDHVADTELLSEQDWGDELDGRYSGPEKTRIEQAEAAGFSIVRASACTALLDLDTAAASVRFNAMIGMVDAKFPLNTILWWYSKSGFPNTHVMLLFRRNYAIMDRLLIESVLGSDPKRSVLNLRKFQQRPYDEPSLLFIPKGTVNNQINSAPWTLP